MDPELRRYIHETTLNRAAIRHIQTMLPDDTELDAWLEQTATDYAGDEFVCLVIAAFGAGREVHARHLAKGAAALAAGDMLPEIAMKLTGDVPGYLMQAVRGAFMNQRGKAEALGIAAVMHKDRGEDIPQAIYSETRALAHSENVEADALPALHGLVMYLGDGELNRSLRQRYFSKLTEAAWRRQCDVARTFPDSLRQQGAMPVIELVGEKAERYVAMGNAPMRRSVPRIGRDPDDLRQLALALLLTKHQPLGILLARGVIPLVSPDAASSLIDWVMEARRQLTLDADDPINEIADMVSTARREASETDAALRETRELLELKAREAREAKESRDQALREVKRREEEMARKREAEAAMATPEEVAALKEWRRKAEKYEQEIRERNTENPEFRRKPALNLNDKLPFLHRRSS